MSAKLNTEDVIQEITKFLNETGGAYDWDDFTSIRIQDPTLNAIRIECAELPDKYPPGPRQYCGDGGLKRLEEILDQLRTRREEPR